jgi:hypothetical protein
VGFYLNQKDKTCAACSLGCQDCVVNNVCDFCMPGYSRYIAKQSSTTKPQVQCSLQAPAGYIVNLNRFQEMNKDALGGLTVAISRPDSSPLPGQTALAVFGDYIITDSTYLPYSLNTDGLPAYKGVLVRLELVPCLHFCSTCAPGFLFNTVNGDCYDSQSCPDPFVLSGQQCISGSNPLRVYIKPLGQNVDGFASDTPLILQAFTNKDQ